MSTLRRSTAIVEPHEGGGPLRKSPSRTEYDAITLERGVTHDPEFEKWASGLSGFASGPGAAVSPDALRRELIIEVCDESGRPVRAYRIHRCWVSEFQGSSDLDANAYAVWIVRLKLENEGWKRDDDLTEKA
jgi:phage tail-like protein